MIFCAMCDRVSGNFGQPFFAPSFVSVQRDLGMLISNPDIPDQYIKDTVVYQFGTFNADPVNPRFDLFDVPQIIWEGDSSDVRELRKKVCSSGDNSDC